jgi:hypothetical protein
MQDFNKSSCSSSTRKLELLSNNYLFSERHCKYDSEEGDTDSPYDELNQADLQRAILVGSEHVIQRGQDANESAA